jgi:hypothetical protein
VRDYIDLEIAHFGEIMFPNKNKRGGVNYIAYASGACE